MIMSTTIRVDAATHRRLQDLSRRLHLPLIDTLREATNALELVQFASTVAAELEALKADPAEWAAYLADGESTTVADGIT